ncbi:sulfatase family protein [Cerasicoccus fimbriatus]|uniref:sulfatase family protein n=1 Tax=Cerasicoccus fimbriatus TaxID=3014554 RepID=UPI0022B32081|nr:sulfatase-like hydrolase/transferase [Cerasicoccus sp. TK19100]
MTAPKRPNILFLFTDQQRADSIGALGNSVMQTPHLDRLCREGTAFTSAYSPSPECVPARCSLITGAYVNHTGCASNAQAMPPEDSTPTFMSILTDAGYRTHGIGKCHFTPDSTAMRGFQTRETSEEVIDADGQSDYFDYVKNEGHGHVMEPLGIRGEMYYVPQPAQQPAELCHSHWVADRTINFINGQANDDQPWLCYAGFIHPHPPFNPPNPWHKLYRAPDMPLPHMPADFESMQCFINRFQNRYKYRDRGYDLNLLRCMRAYYNACVSFIDYQVGRIVASLEASGELDNTLILYSSDHGELLGDFGSFGKRSFHDAAAKVPLIARLPERFQAGEQCDKPASLIDIATTACAAAGESPIDQFDGVDLADLATGNSTRDTVFMQYQRGSDTLISAVGEDYKYTWSAPDQREYLFARSDSPETKDLAGVPGYAAPLTNLKQRLVAHIRDGNHAGDILDDNDEFLRQPPKQLPANPDAGLIYQDPPQHAVNLPEGYAPKKL